MPQPGGRMLGPGQLLVMATGLTGLGGVHAAVADGADLVEVADPALIAAVRAAYPELGIFMPARAVPAASPSAGLICAPGEVDGFLAAGVDPARILVELGSGPDFIRRLADLVAAGRPVLVCDPVLSGQAGEDPAGPLAVIAIAAWLGARVFGTRHVRATRRALTMVGAIRGDIPPANATRGLA
ncbi:MAG: hypothetical protein ACRDOB_27815 [Streptosporangiaceae bacterium]